ncbi:hypothetical protein RUM43_008842 [Polyplax serrata]|uniref:Uncharacterized protein n=1 Tax=Polyplax serrata TaxID=468196 RepID=A0AAN8NNC8_POLSC
MPATPSNATNHNYTTASNFKRQNTVDSATIKENTARINSGNAPTRPTVAKNSVNITALDSSASPGKPRGVTKSNTMTGNRNLSSGGSVGRRSTISYEAKSASNEKTNITGDLGTPSATLGTNENLTSGRANKGHIKSASISTSTASSRQDHPTLGLDTSFDPLQRQR